MNTNMNMNAVVVEGKSQFWVVGLFSKEECCSPIVSENKYLFIGCGIVCVAVSVAGSIKVDEKVAQTNKGGENKTKQHIKSNNFLEPPSPPLSLSHNN